MADIFHSARLTYRGIEANDEDSSFIHTLRLDSAGRAAREGGLFQPVTKASSEITATRLRNECPLAVLICLPDEPKPIGVIFLNKSKLAYDTARNNDIGIQIAPEQQNKGYGGEAINWLLGWAFRHAGLHRVGIACYSWNVGARRLYEHLGFVYEGRRREAYWYDGGWYDEIQLSMLEDEWKQKVQKEKSKEI